MILIADRSSETARSSSGVGPSNGEVADVLERIADLLEAQGANPFRVGAYLGAARTVRRSPRPVVAILADEGVDGLERLPGIGRSIAALIDELAETGRVRLLERLEGSAPPEDTFARVPGIGPVLGGRIHRELGIETLEELELAAHDGRLAEVEGFGERRVEGVRVALAGMLGRSRRRARRGRPTPPAPPPRSRRRLRPPPAGGRRRAPVGVAGRAPSSATARATVAPVARDRVGMPASPEPAPDEPTVADLLWVDSEYRERAAAGDLRRIAPRRFNPEGEAWLPILHTERGSWDFTALHSNTALAHRLGRTRDWVVVYWDRDGADGQATVVSEYRGVLEGLRVVRGREEECLAHYRREGRVWAEDGAENGDGLSSEAGVAAREGRGASHGDGTRAGVRGASRGRSVQGSLPL